MNRAVIIAGILVLAMISCERDDDGVTYEGDAIFTSERMLSGDNYVAFGWSFEQGKNIPYSLTSGSKPDIVVSNVTDVKNNITGAVLSSPGNDKAFKLTGSYGSIEEAQSAFDEYVEVKDSAFTSLAGNIGRNQLWTFKTVSDNYAKILVKEVLIRSDSPVSPYIEIMVFYQYQPDGSKIF